MIALHLWLMNPIWKIMNSWKFRWRKRWDSNVEI